MLRKAAAALIAVTMFTAPALAQTATATQPPTAPQAAKAAPEAGKTVKKTKKQKVKKVKTTKRPHE